MDVIIIEHKIICKYFPLYIFIYLLCNDGNVISCDSKAIGEHGEQPNTF